METYNLFSVPVFRFNADESYDEIQIEIKNSIDKLKEFDDESCLANTKSFSHKKEYDFVEKYNCTKLKDRILKSCTEYLVQSRWRGVLNEEEPIKIDDSWINFYSPGDSIVQHVHPGHDISGVYYFRVTQDHGGIVFTNPNPVSNLCYFPAGNTFPSHTVVIPVRGDVILFPSWLPHKTLKNNSDTDRISIAFNITLNTKKEKINQLMVSSNPQITTVEYPLNFGI